MAPPTATRIASFPVGNDCGLLCLSPDRGFAVLSAGPESTLLRVVNLSGEILAEETLPGHALTARIAPDGRHVLTLIDQGGSQHEQGIVIHALGPDQQLMQPGTHFAVPAQVADAMWLDGQTILTATVMKFAVLAEQCSAEKPRQPLAFMRIDSARVIKVFCAKTRLIVLSKTDTRQVNLYVRSFGDPELRTERINATDLIHDIVVDDSGYHIAFLESSMAEWYPLDSRNTRYGEGPTRLGWAGAVAIGGDYLALLHNGMVSAFLLTMEEARRWGDPWEGGAGPGLQVAAAADGTYVAVPGEDAIGVYRLPDYDTLKTYEDLVANDPERRRHGVEVAARWPADRAVPVLVDVLEAATSPDRDGAVGALAAFGAPGVSELIRFSGRTDDARVQASIAAALGPAPGDPHEKAGTPVDQVVKQALEQGDEDRLGALRLAGHLPWLDAREELHAAVTDTDADVRAAAARSLGQRQDTTAAPMLLSATTDSDARVAAAAADALSTLADMPLPVGTEATGRDYVGRVLASGLPDGADDGGFSALSSLLLDAREPFDDLLQALARYANREPYADAGRALCKVLGDALSTQSAPYTPIDALSVLELALPTDPTEDRGPALTWRTHRLMARIAEPADPERAARHYEEAIGTIDRMWDRLLGDPSDADFFRDKADLYDAALLSAIRLGCSARAVEILEKAKTRYLGDLIARRSPRARTLTRTERDYWRYVGDASVPPDAARARAGGGSGGEIIGVAPTGHLSNVAYVPARLGALLQQADDYSGSSALMIGGVWDWIGALQREAVPHGAETDVGQALRAVLDVLREIRGATHNGFRAPSPVRVAALRDAYATATQALMRLPHPNRGWDLWEGRHWLDEYLATPGGTGQLVFDAVEEAVGFLIAGTPVQAVRHVTAELPTGQVTTLPAFDIGRRRRAAADATDAAGAAAPPYALERDRAWEFVEQIVRGSSVGYNHALKIVQDDPSTAVLQFATTPKGTVVFATAAADAPAWAITGAEDWRGPVLFTNRNVNTSELAKQLGNASAGWHHAYQHRDTDKGKSWREKTEHLIEWLHSELFTPLLPWLRACAAKRLVIVPHRELHQIPVQAWCTPRHGGRRYVLDSFDVCHAPSLTIRSICSARSRERTGPVTNVAAILDPTGNLPLARTELAELRADAAPLKPPTWERWIEAAATADLCHYGGHGRYLPRAPLESSLDLEGERVELGELFGGGFLLPYAQLVTLMGCETAMTADSQDKADEHLGLASGFVFAGAPAVLSTLWVVDEVAAAMLVRRYYEHIMTGMRPSAALGHSQRWLRDDVRHATVRRFLAQTRTILERDGTLDSALGKLEKYRDKYARPGRHPLERPFAHPIFWAPFIVSGVDTAVML